MDAEPGQVDLLLEPEWLVPVRPEGVFTGQAVAVHEGCIVDILPAAEAAGRYRPGQHLRLPGHALLPGLVNLHTHAAMALMRGLADDLPLMTWLQEHIWPAEARHVGPEFVHDGSLLAAAEMLRSGTTCFSDMYFFPDATAQAVDEAGLRAALGLIVIDFPTAWGNGPEDYLKRGLELAGRLADHRRLSFTLAPHAPYTVGDGAFEGVRAASEQTGMPVHIHVHETQEEIATSLAEHGLRPLERLRRLGLVNERLVAVHMVHLQRDEMALLAGAGSHVAHCPSSNLKLASGIGPVVEKLEHQVNVGLGTDGAASNNRLDMFAEMRLAALLAKGQSRQAAALPAQEALAMATLHGARALGLDGRIGSLEPGKEADMVAVRLDAVETLPGYSVISDLVYAAGREQVRQVWVAGRQCLKDGEPVFIDLPALRRRVMAWRERLAGRPAGHPCPASASGRVRP